MPHVLYSGLVETMGIPSTINPVPTRFQTELLNASEPAHIARAAELLRQGHTVAFPTETVYGLGANALDPAAVEKIFVAKQRPHWDPLIVHIADRAQLPPIAAVSTTAGHLMDAFWPGPLTLLLPRTAAIPDAVTAGRPLVGVRVPAHPVALELLRQAGIPIAAPSANTFGHTSPTTAQHVLDDLDGRIAAVLDGGAASVGVESTVVGIADQHVTIYRPGRIDISMLYAATGSVSMYQPQADPLQEPHALPSPGVGLKHYAPRAEVRLVEVATSGILPQNQVLLDALNRAEAEGACTGVMLPTGWNKGPARCVVPWGPWYDWSTLAAHLFTGLRTLDDQGATVIICPLPDSSGLGAAIRDRLRKAARTE